MDFFNIKEKTSTKSGTIEVYPDFTVGRSKDLMVRGKSFYAIWDEEKGLWSTDEYDVQRLVDKELTEYAEKLKESTDNLVRIKTMRDYSSGSWAQFRNYLAHVSDNSHQLDVSLTFANTKIGKKDYVSRKLPYSLEEGPCPAYDELMSTLYNPEERAKLEWAIGSIVSGDSKDIQKFFVLFGPPGSGKSTVLNIIQKLFADYYAAFDAKSLTSSSNGFSMEVFRSNPLIAIDHDSDLSRIEDNTKLNSIVSHEEMSMNEKYKPMYTMRVNAILLIGTNKPVKITDAKAGIIRRLIDVRPTGNKIPTKKYHELMSRIEFELGAIAHKCWHVYLEMGKNYYSAYRPLDMILRTDVFFNFVETYYFTFLEQNGTSLSQAYEMYKTYCTEASIENKLPRHKFRDELKNYFEDFAELTRVEGKQVRSYYSGFLISKFTSGDSAPKDDESPSWLVLDKKTSLLDEYLCERPAQYATGQQIPEHKWVNVQTALSDIDTTKLHYVQPPLNHIVIDFDLRDENGEKSAEKNLEAASKWPPTYAEYSKSGQGIHLHYDYEGDPAKLSNIYDEYIEILVFTGGKSLRRKLAYCNNIPVAKISSGLPFKEEKMINTDVVKNEKGIRTLIKKNLAKEYLPGTKPSIDFIYQILEEAYASGMPYDVSDLQNKVLLFANNSTHQADYCLKMVAKMKFRSEEPSVDKAIYDSDKIAFFDVEVFPNLFVVCWKYLGEENKTIRMFNPSAKDIEDLLRLRLVGFNNRRYDNHILYARYIGYEISELFMLSQRIIDGENRNALFGEAYNISYADVFDFSSKKQSLKKFQIELGIHHKELGLPWDKPVPEEKWLEVGEYCENDVVSLEAVFADRKEDFVARRILADLSGLTVNDTTQMHTAKIVFGDKSRPQEEFVYTDLSELFPGYKFEGGKSTYRGEETGEGGYVYAEPGSYTNVALLDVASMHPTSIELLNLFGPYTKNYSEIKAARIAIKRKEYDKAKEMLGGVLTKYLGSDEESAALAYALKIVINIVYGLTSAAFANKFRDPRNVDNIVAKRGALFMIDLKHAVQEQGYTVAHIKTDSIKIPNADKRIIDFVFEFGKKYGYTFEHEATYDRFCLVNDAVYIARYADGKHKGEWTATGAQFAHPYVFKKLFSKEPIVFEDLCETKGVTTALYLDMNESLGPDEHNYQFVGKAGSFAPIKPGYGGGILLREKDGKYYAATGSKGYRWLEGEVVRAMGKEEDVDRRYHQELADAAIDDLSKFVDFNWFVSYDN